MTVGMNTPARTPPSSPGSYADAVARFTSGAAASDWARLAFFRSGLAARAVARADARQCGGAQVLPPPAELFNALTLTAPDAVKVVILGQDPYPTPGDAHGLAFSVNRETAPPRSLRNIFRELAEDLGVDAPQTCRLSGWASQGVLLLNAALTVEAGNAGAHRKFGWDALADEIVASLAAGDSPVVFMLWGADARKFAPLVLARDAAQRHLVIESAHPSPLSARRGFFGSKPFSRANNFLQANGRAPIDWSQTG